MADISTGPNMLPMLLRDSRVFGGEVDDGGNDMSGLEMTGQALATVLQAVSQRVRRTRKAAKGSVTFTIEITGHPDKQSVSCEHEVKLGTIKLPKREPAVLRGWIDEEGNHLGTQPQQEELPLRGIDGGKAKDSGKADKGRKASV